jgi:transcriptional regulator with XRE-family HTH domain
VPRVASDAADHIGRLIASHRHQTGMTQDQLAAASGIDSSNIRAYGNGRATPNLFTLARISDALGVEPGVLLLGLTPEMFPTSNPRAG